jgi:hypothetical protein
MLNAMRIIAGVVLVALALYLASLAVKDCSTGIYAWENCLWLAAREQTGLPPSKFLRALVLEIVGVSLLAGLYLTIRYVFPLQKTRGEAEGSRPESSPSARGSNHPSAPENSTGK